MKLILFSILLLILTGCHQSTQPDNCGSFKNGKFMEVYGDTLHITIDRKGGQQVETSELGTSHYKITWLSECEYESQLLETTIDYAQKWIGKRYKIIILSTSKKGYSFSCQMEGKDLVVESSVVKVE